MRSWSTGSGRSEKWRHLVPLRFSEYLEAEEFYPRIVENPDAFGSIAEVYHLGACSATTERDATYLIANNYRTTQDLATWTLGRDARFVYASSAATYGSRETDLREDLDPHSLVPLNMYGYSKHLFDLWARREGILDRIVGLKFFNVYGPNEDHKGDMRSVVAKAYEQISGRGHGEAVRELPPRHPRRRTDARLPLRQGRGRDRAASRPLAAAHAVSTTSAPASRGRGTISRRRSSPRSSAR